MRTQAPSAGRTNTRKIASTAVPEGHTTFRPGNRGLRHPLGFSCCRITAPTPLRPRASRPTPPGSWRASFRAPRGCQNDSGCRMASTRASGVSTISAPMPSRVSHQRSGSKGECLRFRVGASRRRQTRHGVIISPGPDQGSAAFPAPLRGGRALLSRPLTPRPQRRTAHTSGNVRRQSASLGPARIREGLAYRLQGRVRAGLAGARSEAPALEKRIREALATPGRPGIRVIAERFGVNPSTVQRISASPFAHVAVAP